MLKNFVALRNCKLVKLLHRIYILRGNLKECWCGAVGIGNVLVMSDLEPISFDIVMSIVFFVLFYWGRGVGFGGAIRQKIRILCFILSFLKEKKNHLLFPVTQFGLRYCWNMIEHLLRDLLLYDLQDELWWRYQPFSFPIFVDRSFDSQHHVFWNLLSEFFFWLLLVMQFVENLHQNNVILVLFLIIRPFSHMVVKYGSS